MRHFLAGNLCHRLGRIRVIQLGLGLPFEPGIRVLDGNNRRHTVPDVRAGKIGVFLFQNAEFPGVIIHHHGKLRLEAGDVCAALGIIDVIAEAQNVFLKFPDVLEGHLHGDIFRFPLEIDRIMQYFPVPVQIPHKPDNPFRLMKNGRLVSPIPAVAELDCQIRIQISGLVQAAFQIRRGKSCCLENLTVRQKVNGGSGFLCLSQHRKLSVFQLYHRNPSLKPVVMNIAVSADPDIHVGGKGIDHRRADAVQPAAGFVDIIVKLSAGMESGKYQALRRHSLFMQADGNSAAIVRDRAGTIRLQNDNNLIAASRKMLVHRIIHDFIDQVVQSLSPGASDIHAGTHPHRFQPFQHTDAFFTVINILSHASSF